MDRKTLSEITPTEFEMRCRDILAGYAESERLRNFRITHNKIIHAHDGKYQIDIYAEFIAMGVQIRVLCECKRYKNRVNRDKVAILHRKLDSIGAHKGILISTSDFQSGAIEYAKTHGIALIKAEDYHFEFLSHSSGEKDPDENDPFLYLEHHWPPYEAFDCTKGADNPVKVYPTKEMVKRLYAERQQKMKEVLGIDIPLDSLEQ